jgi:exodeoxyribonuclease III
MKLISWNVNGIRAIMNKNFTQAVHEMNADVLCLQETKAQPEQVAEAIKSINGYHVYANSAERKGYSSTAILSKTKPLSVTHDMDMPEHDNEGRVITAEFETFYLVTVYTPNSGSELLRLEYRQQWDADFLKFLKKLEAKKPVLVCGDLNVAHRDIDLANAKANYNKYAGYMQQEIDGMDNYIKAGFVDTFRHFYPEQIKYTWWSYRAGARERNVGWRIDYFLASKSFMPNIKDAFILNEYHGSDHCPVGIIVH